MNCLVWRVICAYLLWLFCFCFISLGASAVWSNLFLMQNKTWFCAHCLSGFLIFTMCDSIYSCHSLSERSTLFSGWQKAATIPCCNSDPKMSSSGDLQDVGNYDSFWEVSQFLNASIDNLCAVLVGKSNSSLLLLLLWARLLENRLNKNNGVFNKIAASG